MILKRIEDTLFGNRSECQFQEEYDSHMLLFPGMLGPIYWMFPLVQYLRKNQSHYGVTAIPLGQTNGMLDEVASWAEEKIVGRLNNPKRIILFGHSHGGRVACVVFQRLSPKFPDTQFGILTAGTPIDYIRKKGAIPRVKRLFYNLLSPAFRLWPDVRQPDHSSANIDDYIGFYADGDTVVAPEVGYKKHTGKRIKLEGFSHIDMIDPRKMGPVLLEYLSSK